MKEIIYIMPQIESFGEPIFQMWQLKNLYQNINQFRITVITYPLAYKPKMNTYAFKIATRGMNIVHSLDNSIVWLSSIDRLNQNIIKGADKEYVLLINDNLTYNFAKEYYHKQPNYYYTLTDSELEMGENLKKRMSIPKNAPLATLHVREPGYNLASSQYHRRRDVNIENYVPAIKWLIDNGFYVIRIGDPSMKKLVNAPYQLIDAPFNTNYTNFTDPYFIAVSNLFICCNSGAGAFGFSFGTPMLYLNQLPWVQSWSNDNTLFVFKKIYSNQLKRNLTYEELLLSPYGDCYDSDSFTESKIQHIENTPEEILLAAKEMVQRLNGSYRETENINTRVQKIHEKAHHFRRYLAPVKNPYAPCLPLHATNAKISHEFIKLNPDFLGHDWSDLKVGV